AFITKGYAYAYQALGKYMWDSKEKDLSEETLAVFDEVLADKVYKKIWSELAPKDQWYLKFIMKKETMDATELLELTKTSHSEWSVPRARLKEKGVIDVSKRGVISLKLPRFREFIVRQMEEAGEL
ncbi:MAG: ATP-binding protein, partial [Lachnospiraceae bacterium]|nr:ATP-binding protein [Lachnospiraceae bacterium]